jgi:hypothetical protein
MAGRFTIQRFPTGLPSLLVMNASGDVPPNLSQEVSASLELIEFYLGPDVFIAEALTAAISAAGFNSSVVAVPAGEIWAVRSVSVAFGTGLGAATTATIRPAWQRRGFTLTNQTMLGDISATGTTAGIPGASHHFDAFRLFYPGDTFGCWCEAFAGVAQAVSVRVEHNRIRI